MKIDATANALGIDLIIAAGAFECALNQVTDSHFFRPVQSVEKFLYDRPKREATIEQIRKALLIPKRDELLFGLNCFPNQILKGVGREKDYEVEDERIICLKYEKKTEEKMEKFETMFSDAIAGTPKLEAESILKAFDIMIESVFPDREIRSNVDRMFFMVDIWRDIIGRVFGDRKGHTFIRMLYLYIFYLFGEREKSEIVKVMPLKKPIATTWYLKKHLLDNGLCNRASYKKLYHMGDPDGYYSINEEGTEYLAWNTEACCAGLNNLWTKRKMLCEDPDGFLYGFRMAMEAGFRIIRRNGALEKIVL